MQYRTNSCSYIVIFEAPGLFLWQKIIIVITVIIWFIKRRKVVTSEAAAKGGWGQTCTLQSNAKEKKYVLSRDLKVIRESLLVTSEGSEFQTDGAGWASAGTLRELSPIWVLTGGRKHVVRRELYSHTSVTCMSLSSQLHSSDLVSIALNVKFFSVIFHVNQHFVPPKQVSGYAPE